MTQNRLENDSKITEKRLEIDSPGGGRSVGGVEESGEWAVAGKQYHKAGLKFSSEIGFIHMFRTLRDSALKPPQPGYA